MGSKPRILTLYSRAYCHLCDDMAAALLPLRTEFEFDLHVVDVDAEPALEERYGERVPVLLHGETELCHYFLDAAQVRAYLEAFASTSASTAQPAPSC